MPRRCFKIAKKDGAAAALGSKGPIGNKAWKGRTGGGGGGELAFVQSALARQRVACSQQKDAAPVRPSVCPARTHVRATHKEPIQSRFLWGLPESPPHLHPPPPPNKTK